MKRISLILLVAALILGLGIGFSYDFDKGIYEGSSSAIKDLRNLNLLMSLSLAGKATLKASTVVSQDSQKEITAGLPQVITRRNVMDLSLQDFIRQHQEEIAIELSQIIIRKNLASLTLQGI